MMYILWLFLQLCDEGWVGNLLVSNHDKQYGYTLVEYSLVALL